MTPLPRLLPSGKSGKQAYLSLHHHQAKERFLDNLAKVAALPQPITREQINEVCGGNNTNHFLDRCNWTSWVKVGHTPSGDGYHITVNNALRAVCEANMILPDSNNETPHDFIRRVRTEIHQRRETIRARTKQTKWSHDSVAKIELLEILDWIEKELETIHF